MNQVDRQASNVFYFESSRYFRTIHFKVRLDMAKIFFKISSALYHIYISTSILSLFIIVPKKKVFLASRSLLPLR